MTPEREKYLREDAAWGTLPATKRLEVFAALDEARGENERLRDQLDAAYDAHAGECPKCRIRWAQLRESRDR